MTTQHVIQHVHTSMYITNYESMPHWFFTKSNNENDDSAIFVVTNVSIVPTYRL